MAQELVNNEHILLQSLGFEVSIEHPHTFVVKTCQLVRASKDLAQTSYFLATNSLHLTTMCLEYSPKIVCCVCILLACKWANWEIPKSSEGKDWVWYVDSSITMEEVERLTQDFLNILDKCPSKLKNKLMANKEEEGERMGAVEDYPVDHGDLSNIHDYGAGGSGEIPESRQAEAPQESSLRRVQTEPVLLDRGHSSAAAHRPPVQPPSHGSMHKEGVKHSTTTQHQQSSSSRPPSGVPSHGATKPSSSGSRPPPPSASTSHPPGGDKLREGHHAAPQSRPGQPASSSSQHPGSSMPRSSQHGAPPPSSGSLQHRPPPSSSASHTHGSDPAEKVRRLEATVGGDANRHYQQQQQQQQQRPRDHGHHHLPPQSSSASHGGRPDVAGMRPEGHSSSSASRQSGANVRHDRRPDDRHSGGGERRLDDHSSGRERRDSYSDRARNHQSAVSGSGHRSYDSHAGNRHSTSSSASGLQRSRLHSGGSSEAETRPPSSLSRETSREDQRHDSSADPPESEEVIAKRRQELLDSLEEGEVSEELEKLDHISPVKTLADRDPMRDANAARLPASSSSFAGGRAETKSSSGDVPSNGSGSGGQHAVLPSSLSSSAVFDVEKDDQGKLTPIPSASGSSTRLPIAAMLSEDAHRNSPKVKVSLSDYRDRIKTAPAPEPAEQLKSRSGDVGSTLPSDSLASLKSKDLPDVFSLFNESSGRQSPSVAPPPAVKLKLPKFGEAIKLGMAAAAAEEALANSAAANDELNTTDERSSIQEGVEPAAGETPMKLVLKVKKDTVSGQYSSSASKHSSEHRHHSHHGHRHQDATKGGEGSRPGATGDQHESRKRVRSPSEQHKSDKHRRTSSSASSSERHAHQASSASNKRPQPNGSDGKDEKQQRVEQLQVIQSTIELISQMSKAGPPPSSQ